MSAPTGIEKEVYSSPVKLSETRVAVRLDVPIVSANFTDLFSGASLDSDLWSYQQPPGSNITVSGGKLTLRAVDTNAYPVVWSIPGKTFPLDLTIGWTITWVMSYPVITGYGVFFRVVDLTHDQAIVACKCNSADGFTLEAPDGTVVESLGLDTGEHTFTLVYTPATNIAAASYELTRDGVSKKTFAATDRQAWCVVIGNGSIQTSIGTWTEMAVNSVTVAPLSFEAQDWPDWTDRDQHGDGTWWGRIPWASSVSLGFHERETVSQAVISIPQSGYITGIGYKDDWFHGFRWSNREVSIESRQGDGKRWTSWKTIHTGLCDEPRISHEEGGSRLEITVRDKVRRRLQMAHIVRGYSSDGGIDGVVGGKTWTEIIEDVCDVVGLETTDYNVLSNPLKPRTRQFLSESALDAVSGLCDEGGVALYTNRSQANFGRLEVQEYAWGSDTPDFYLAPVDAAGIEWSETVLGMTAQVIVTVQHSEFGEFSDMYPRAPIPPFGAVIRKNAAIAQSATDINTTRLLPFIYWQNENRELNAVTVRMQGQDWIEIGEECQVLDRTTLDIASEHYVVIGADYSWTPDNGCLTTIYLANQHPENAIMRASLDASLAVSWPMPPIEGDLDPTGALVKRIQLTLKGALTLAGIATSTRILTLVASLSSVGTVIKQVNKGLAGILTSAGALVRQLALTLRGAINNTNLVSNPSFEQGTNGWGLDQAGSGTFTRVASEVYVGSYSGEFVSNGAMVYSGIYYDVPSGWVPGQTYTASAWIKRATVGKPPYFRLYDGITYTYVGAADIDGWQKLTTTLAFAPAATVCRIIVQYADDPPPAGVTFYVDGVQLELGGSATDYVDGNMVGERTIA